MLLSLFFLKRPDESFFKKLKHKNFIANLENIVETEKEEISRGLKLIKSFLDFNKNADEKEVLEKLAIDFTKLTRGIKKGYGPPPPYESVWRMGEDVIMGEITQEVIEFYLKSGIGMDLEGEIPDHIGIELKFMSLLCYKEKQHWDNGKYKEALKCLNLEKDFLEKHILNWAPFYLEEMEKEAETNFYKGLAIFTRDFLTIDKKIINEILNFSNPPTQWEPQWL